MRVCVGFCRTSGAEVQKDDDSALVVVNDFNGKFVQISVSDLSVFLLSLYVICLFQGCLNLLSNEVLWSSM